MKNKYIFLVLVILAVLISCLYYNNSIESFSAYDNQDNYKGIGDFNSLEEYKVFEKEKTRRERNIGNSMMSDTEFSSKYTPLDKLAHMDKESINRARLHNEFERIQMGMTGKDIREQEHPSKFRDNYSMNEEEMVKRGIGVKPRSYVDDSDIFESRNQKIKEVDDISSYSSDKKSILSNISNQKYERENEDLLKKRNVSPKARNLGLDIKLSDDGKLININDGGKMIQMKNQIEGKQMAIEQALKHLYGDSGIFDYEDQIVTKEVYDEKQQRWQNYLSDADSGINKINEMKTDLEQSRIDLAAMETNINTEINTLTTNANSKIADINGRISNAITNTDELNDNILNLRGFVDSNSENISSLSETVERELALISDFVQGGRDTINNDIINKLEQLQNDIDDKIEEEQRNLGDKETSRRAELQNKLDGIVAKNEELTAKLNAIRNSNNGTINNLVKIMNDLDNSVYKYYNKWKREQSAETFLKAWNLLLLTVYEYSYKGIDNFRVRVESGEIPPIDGIENKVKAMSLGWMRMDFIEKLRAKNLEHIISNPLPRGGLITKLVRPTTFTGGKGITGFIYKSDTGENEGCDGIRDSRIELCRYLVAPWKSSDTMGELLPGQIASGEIFLGQGDTRADLECRRASNKDKCIKGWNNYLSFYHDKGNSYPDKDTESTYFKEGDFDKSLHTSDDWTYKGVYEGFETAAGSIATPTMTDDDIKKCQEHCGESKKYFFLDDDNNCTCSNYLSDTNRSREIDSLRMKNWKTMMKDNNWGEGSYKSVFENNNWVDPGLSLPGLRPLTDSIKGQFEIKSQPNTGDYFGSQTDDWVFRTEHGGYDDGVAGTDIDVPEGFKLNWGWHWARRAPEIGGPPWGRYGLDGYPENSIEIKFNGEAGKEYWFNFWVWHHIQACTSCPYASIWLKKKGETEWIQQTPNRRVRGYDRYGRWGVRNIPICKGTSSGSGCQGAGAWRDHKATDPPCCNSTPEQIEACNTVKTNRANKRSSSTSLYDRCKSNGRPYRDYEYQVQNNCIMCTGYRTYNPTPPPNKNQYTNNEFLKLSSRKPSGTADAGLSHDGGDNTYVGFKIKNGDIIKLKSDLECSEPFRKGARGSGYNSAKRTRISYKLERDYCPRGKLYGIFPFVEFHVWVAKV